MAFPPILSPFFVSSLLFCTLPHSVQLYITSPITNITTISTPYYFRPQARVPRRFATAAFIRAHRQELSVGQASALCDLFEAEYDLVRAAWEVFLVQVSGWLGTRIGMGMGLWMGTGVSSHGYNLSVGRT